MKETLTRMIRVAKKQKIGVLALAVVLLLTIVALCLSNTTEVEKLEASFAEWADSMQVASVQLMYVEKGYAAEYEYSLLDEAAVQKVVKMLQDIPEEKCYSKKQTVLGYQGIRLRFLYDGKEIILKCLSDKSILFMGSSEFPHFALKEQNLILDSAELWNYLVNMTEKDVPQDENSEETENSEQTNTDLPQTEERVVYTTTADLNHDGIEDRIDLLMVYSDASLTKEEYAYLRIYLGNGNGGFEESAVCATEGVSDVHHSANGTYVLTEKDGKDYLLFSQFHEQQGGAAYGYSVMYVKDGVLSTEISDHIEFCLDPFMKQWYQSANRASIIPDFCKELEPWIENGEILVSYDTKTTSFRAVSETKIPASYYYDLIWSLNEDDRIAEFEAQVGKEEWKQYFYYISAEEDYKKLTTWFDAELAGDLSKWYENYDGSKLQIIENCEGASCSVNVSCNEVYYKAGKGEDEQDAIIKILSAMLDARMTESPNRPYVITKYRVPEQDMIPISENMWFIKIIDGFYAYEGSDMGTMEEHIGIGEVVTEDGLLPFMAQGSDEQFYHVLIKKDGVYRLQRLDLMYE